MKINKNRTADQRAMRYRRINTELNTKGVDTLRYALNDLYAEWEDGTWRNDSIFVENENGKTYRLYPDGDFNVWLTFGPQTQFVCLKMDGQDNGRMTVENLQIFAAKILGERSAMLKMFHTPKKKGGQKRPLTNEELAALDPKSIRDAQASRSLRGGSKNFSVRTLHTRLKEEFPEFYAKLQAGEFPSVTAAAIAAGLKTDPYLPLAQLRRAWKRASAEEREAFELWKKDEASKCLASV